MGEKKKDRKKKSATSTNRKAITPTLKKTRQPFYLTAKRVLLILWSIIGGLGVVASIWVSLSPRISVNPAVSLDKQNPAFTPFTVSNDGYLSVWDVKFMCAIKEVISVSGQRLTGNENYSSRLQGSTHIANSISAGEKYTELLPLTSLTALEPIKSADIAIVISFRPNRLTPWHIEKKFKFITALAKDGNTYWFAEPIDK